MLAAPIPEVQSVFRFMRDYAYFYDSPEIIKVPAGPLDDVLAGQTFDVILMDVDGSEYFALRGMQTLLAFCASAVCGICSASS